MMRSIGPIVSPRERTQMPKDDFPKWDYKEYPKTLPKEDLWGQVRRTVNGQPIDEDEIQKMVDGVLGGLQLETSDHVLDLACGNGALSARLFSHCASLHGVDYSEYLVSVARELFGSARHVFDCQDVFQYVDQEPQPLRFTKALCFGSVGYFSDATLAHVLSQLKARFVNLRRFYIGNIADADKAGAFYGSRPHTPEDLQQHESQIGRWRSPTELATLAHVAGWVVEVQALTADAYQAHYRYNAILRWA